MTAMSGKGTGASTGDVAWRLVNMLSLNHLGLVERAAGDGAKALRETLVLFADVSDSATERKIRGLRSLTRGRSCGACGRPRAPPRRAASR